MARLATLTFGDLKKCVDEKLKRAREQSSLQAWQRLREVIEELAGASPRQGEFDPAASGAVWWLIRVEVSGIRGIPESGMALDFEAGPGITIVHGANGSGKSSFAHGIDMAIHGSTAGGVVRASGVAGKARVWAPVPVHDQAPSGRVQLVLQQSTGDKLALTVKVPRDGEVEIQATRTPVGGVEEAVTLGSGWRAAAVAYSPVFAYAEWESYIQNSKQLQEYLQRLLVLGNCFSLVRDEIATRSEEALEAAREVEQARAETELNLAQLASDEGRPTISLLSLGDNVETWLSENELVMAGGDEVPVKLDPQALDALNGLFDDVETATLAVAGLGQQQNPGLIGHLKDLNDAPDDSPLLCPVCGSATDWRKHLQETLKANKEVVVAVTRWRRLIDQTIEAASVLLAAMGGVVETSERVETDRAIEILRRLRQTFLDSGYSDRCCAAAEELGQHIRSDSFADEYRLMVERASDEARWRRSCAAAVAPFLQIVQTRGEQAIQSKLWDDVKKQLAKLETDLMQQREGALRVESSRVLKHLLQDVGMEISNLKVLKRQATVELQEDGGNVLGPGMLSAGQRNALLLAPALAGVEESPFGFLIVDDPVHSFDELRVDYLAKHLVQVAKDRRVIVLTHDERLREHLVASSLDADARSVRRAPGSNGVCVINSPSISALLMDDAEALMLLDNSPDTLMAMTNPIRILCRQAVENALRRFVVARAIVCGQDPREWLEKLDDVSAATTKKRLGVAADLVGSEGSVAIDRAKLLMSPYDVGWNRASHGNPPQCVVSNIELQAARSACDALS